MVASPQQQVTIQRPLYEQEQLHKDFEYHKRKSCVWKKVAGYCTSIKPRKCLTRTIPALGWLPKYKWKQDLLADIVAGITVAVMHIPQDWILDRPPIPSMAYGMLGNVPPVIGIYMAVFPVLIYFFLGTSRHDSMGTFAVVCLMTGKTVLEHSHPSYFEGRALQMNVSDEVTVMNSEKFYTPAEVATAVTFVVAIYQLLMYTFRLGIVSALLSETLVSGFTTGAAVQVLVSQIKDLLGLSIPKHKGFFVVIYSLQSIFQEIPNFNPAATIISAVTIVLSSFSNEILKPALAKKCFFPLPIELAAIITGTLVSKFYNMDEEYGVKTVGEIPKGLPLPTPPPFELLKDVALDGLTISIVAYTVALSMALIFAQKNSYKVDANQELLAQGAGNIVGSFFSCMPFSASLSRSSIQEAVGGRTQIASVVSCTVLVIVLMWIGPFFEPLPKAVLASVIVVALKGMLVQVTALFRFWKLSKMDAAVWLVTFLTVVFVSIDMGLLLGVAMSLITILVLGFKPYTCLLGSIPHTDLYLDVNRYKGTVQIPGIKIFHYCGGVNFASRKFFQSELYRLIGFQPQKELALRKRLAKIADAEEYSSTDKDSINGKSKRYEKLQKKANADIKCLILDFSALSYIDPSSISTLKIISQDFRRIDIPIYIAGCSAPVYELMSKCDLINSTTSLRVFPTIHDAVQCAIETFNRNENELVIPTISRL